MTVDGDLPVTESRQNDKSLFYDIQLKIKNKISSKPQKGKAVLETMNIKLFVPAKNSKNKHSHKMNFF